MDCTYKTNIYNYLLLEIVGVTSTTITFIVAFTFLDQEKEIKYAWMLDKLHRLFVNNV